MSIQMLNSITLVGRLTKNPELRKVNDKSVLNITVAVGKNAKEGEPEADFIPIVCWNKTAEILAMGNQGSLISVEGKLRSRSYEIEGDKKYTLEVQVDKVCFLEKAETRQNINKTDE